MIELSILIAHTYDRADSLNRLKAELERQIIENNAVDKVVIVICSSQKGTVTIGEIRNKLKEAAIGKYICYIDDDDMPAPNYLKLILEALAENPDIVTFTMVMYLNGVHDKTFHINVFAGEGGTGKPHYNINRLFFHLCPHKKEIADKVMFPNKDFMEDAEYTERIKPFIKKEANIGEAIYYYYKKQAA